jgi:DNA-binding CsgD family transcriptional regulator
LLIIDAQAQVRHSFWNDSEDPQIKQLLCGPEAELQADVAATVSAIISHRGAASFGSRIVMRDGGRTLRLSRLVGTDGGDLFALVMEADRSAGILVRCATKYRLTRRQTEVLALVFDGASASDVAHALVISEYTAQGYIKSLLAKTGSRNRAGMVAKLLNWTTTRLDSQAPLSEKRHV